MRYLILDQNVKNFRCLEKILCRSALLDHAFTKEIFFQKFYTCEYDLVILNYSKNKTEILEIIQEIKSENHNLPIICFTEDNVDFSLEEILVSQINFLFVLPQSINFKKTKITQANLSLDIENNFFYAGNRTLKLKNKEYLLLKYLFLNQNRFFSKEHLFYRITKNIHKRNSNLIDVYIYHLRKILKASCSGLQIINQKNCGYKIAAC